jgi:NRPS condensation-like uncharacterized protein
MEQLLGLAEPAAEGETTFPRNVTPALTCFLGALDQAFSLPPAQQRAMRDDFLRGIDALSVQGMPFAEILRRLEPSRLCGFYACGQETFYPLDNGAKQYPLSMRQGQMPMFRVSATLDEPVNPAMLQLALTFTLRRFPHYATRLRRGAFWYYLKPYPSRYPVGPQRGAPLMPIDLSDESEPLFRVLYRGNKLFAELFHILTDGMGGIIFLKSLLAEYYRLLGENTVGDGQTLDTAAPSLPEDVENSFSRFRSRKRGDSLIAPRAMQMPVQHLPGGEYGLEEYRLSAAELLRSAHRHGVSATALMSAVILTACRQTAQAGKGMYRLQVPVDLRRIFTSRSLRNFSWYGTLTSDAAQALSKDELAACLSAQLKENTARDTLERNISAAQRTIRRLRFVPLQWKTAFLRTAYRMTGDYFFTSTLSNLGRIDLPDPLRAHVSEIAAALGPSPSNPYVFALATVNDCAILSITRTTEDRALILRLIESARAYGLTMDRKG